MDKLLRVGVQREPLWRMPGSEYDTIVVGVRCKRNYWRIYQEISIILHFVPM